MLYADSSSKNRRRQNNNATTNNTNNGNNDKSVRNGNQYKPNVENKNNKKSNRYLSTSSPKRGGSKHNNTSYLSTMSSDEINHAGFLADEAENSDLSFSSGEDFAVAAEFRLKLNNLPTLCNDLLLYTTFAPYGAIKWVKTALDDDGRCSSGNAWVAFRRRKDAEIGSANLRNTKLGERSVQIERTYNSV